MQRLGKNLEGYCGETIDITAVQRECVAAAQPILGFTRQASSRTKDAPRIYVSTGIHGDEPAGPLAVRELLQEDAWPQECSLWLCPCLNPGGFVNNQRENPRALDLNRQYLAPEAEETVAHIAWLQRQPTFDLCLCLHEDWESRGFYLYEQNPDNQPSLAETMVERIAQVCPVDRSEIIEGRPARNGIIRPNLDPRTRPQWPEAFFLIMHKTRLSYTLEAPSDYPLATRVAALLAGVRTALEIITSRRARP
jgi:murein peptide amidase A